jgi:hypothetical protein
MTDPKGRLSPNHFSPSRSSIRSTASESQSTPKKFPFPVGQPFTKKRKLSPSSYPQRTENGNSSTSTTMHLTSSIPIPSPGSGQSVIMNSPLGQSTSSHSPDSHSPGSPRANPHGLVHNTSFVPPPPLPIIPVRSPSPSHFIDPALASTDSNFGPGYTGGKSEGLVLHVES